MYLFVLHWVLPFCLLHEVGLSMHALLHRFVWGWLLFCAGLQKRLTALPPALRSMKTDYASLRSQVRNFSDFYGAAISDAKKQVSRPDMNGQRHTDSAHGFCCETAIRDMNGQRHTDSSHGFCCETAVSSVPLIADHCSDP